MLCKISKCSELAKLEIFTGMSLSQWKDVLLHMEQVNALKALILQLQVTCLRILSGGRIFSVHRQ